MWTHFPLVTPIGQPLSIDNILRKVGIYEDYTYERPVKAGDIKIISPPNHYDALTDTVTSGLITTYGQQIREVGLGSSFLSLVDDRTQFSRATQLIRKIFVPSEELASTTRWLYDRTLELVKEKHIDIKDHNHDAHAVDLVKDVLRLVPVHWSSTKVVRAPFPPTLSTI